MLLDEESGRNRSGVAAMSELQEDRNAQSNSGFIKPSFLGAFLLSAFFPNPPLCSARLTEQELTAYLLIPVQLM